MVFFALTVFKTKGCAYIAMKIIEKFFLEKTFLQTKTVTGSVKINNSFNHCQGT